MSSTAPAEDIKLVGRSISDAGLSEDVNRLADCLGLRDGSYGELVPVFVSYAASVGRLSLAQTISYNGLPDSFYDALRCTSDPEHAIRPCKSALNLFTARYLPALVRAISLLPPCALRPSPWYHVLHCIASRSEDYPLFGLFMRARSEDAHAFALACLDALTFEIPSIDSFISFDEDAVLWTMFSMIVFKSLGLLSPSTHQAVRIPGAPARTSMSSLELLRLTHDFRQAMVSLEPACQIRPKVERAGIVSAGIFLLLESGGILSTSFLGKDINLSDIVNDARGRNPWYRCEGLRTVEHACQEPAPGQEMPCCGKCQAVRYCCRAIQKADWKTHKIHCIAPEW